MHRTCTETAAVSCGTSHASTVNTSLVDIQKHAIKLVTHVEPHASAVSLLKRADQRIALYKRSSINQILISVYMCWALVEVLLLVFVYMYLFKLLYTMQLKKHISVSVIIDIDGKMNKPLASFIYIYIKYMATPTPSG